MTTCRVLVVDDEVDSCHNLSDILTDLGHKVAIAHHGEQALRLVRTEPYDVALLDFKMPGMDGLTISREIKRLRPEIVSVLMTAYATPETADRAIQAGAWRVLDKPVDLPQLMSLVDTIANQPLVLIVDDEADLCASLGDVLRNRGFRVAVAGGELEAVANLQAGQQRVILTDMQLSDGDGLGVYRAVQKLAPRARVVLITGHRKEMQDVIDRTLAEGADAVCYKPFDMPRLIETVQQLAAFQE